MAVNGASGVSSDRNYLDSINSDKSEKPGKIYNAVFANGDEDQLSISDFFDMMILQLTNQDFMNPVDDTQYLTQMAQFATMQEMMDLAQFSKQNYVMSMLGKEVTVSNNVIGGQTKNTVGRVEKITLKDGEFKIYVDGKPYDLNKIIQVQSESAVEKPDDEKDKTDKVEDKNDTADKVEDKNDNTDIPDDEVTNGDVNDDVTGGDKVDPDVTEGEGNEETVDPELAEKIAQADG